MPLSPYLTDMRRAVGHALLNLPAAVTIVRDDAGRFLLVRHLETNQWALIGGAIEPVEDPEVAALREAKEEAGVDLELDGILGVFGGPDHVVTYGNGDVVSYVAVTYAAHIIAGMPTPDHEETGEVGWFEASELSALDLTRNARTTLMALAMLPS